MTAFDQIMSTQAPGEPEPKPTYDPSFFEIEGCPHCHRKGDGSAHAGRERFNYCIADHCRWSMGLSPWTVTPEQTEVDRVRWERLGMDDYELVPIWMAGAELVGKRNSDFKN